MAGSGEAAASGPFRAVTGVDAGEGGGPQGGDRGRQVAVRTVQGAAGDEDRSPRGVGRADRLEVDSPVDPDRQVQASSGDLVTQRSIASAAPH